MGKSEWYLEDFLLEADWSWSAVCASQFSLLENPAHSSFHLNAWPDAQCEINSSLNDHLHSRRLCCLTRQMDVKLMIVS